MSEYFIRHTPVSGAGLQSDVMVKCRSQSRSQARPRKAETETVLWGGHYTGSPVVGSSNSLQSNSWLGGLRYLLRLWSFTAPPPLHYSDCDVVSCVMFDKFKQVLLYNVVLIGWCFPSLSLFYVILSSGDVLNTSVNTDVLWDASENMIQLWMWITFSTYFQKMVSQ